MLCPPTNQAWDAEPESAPAEPEPEPEPVLAEPDSAPAEPESVSSHAVKVAHGYAVTLCCPEMEQAGSPEVSSHQLSSHLQVSPTS